MWLYSLLAKVYKIQITSVQYIFPPYSWIKINSRRIHFYVIQDRTKGGSTQPLHMGKLKFLGSRCHEWSPLKYCFSLGWCFFQVRTYAFTQITWWYWWCTVHLGIRHHKWNPLKYCFSKGWHLFQVRTYAVT